MAYQYASWTNRELQGIAIEKLHSKCRKIMKCWKWRVFMMKSTFYGINPEQKNMMDPRTRKGTFSENTRGNVIDQTSKADISLLNCLLSALCFLLSALCSLHSALCSLLSALWLSALHSLLSGLCSLVSAQILLTSGAKARKCLNPISWTSFCRLLEPRL